MITHVVFFRFHEHSLGRLDEAAEAFVGLGGTIDELVSITAGRNVLPSERAYDLCLIAEVADLDGLTTYRDHPAHREVAAWVDTCSASVVSVDFESRSDAAERGR